MSIRFELIRSISRLSRYRFTTRRLMLAVLIAAVLTHGRPMPGWYLPVGCRLRLGICRDESRGRYLGRDGRPMGWAYQAGLWYAGDAGDAGEMLAGVAMRDGTVVVVTALNRHYIAL